MKRTLLTVTAACVLAVGLVACGGDDDDDTTEETTTASATSEATETTEASATSEASAEEDETAEATTEDDSAATDASITTVALSADGNDRYMHLATADDGSFFTTGFVADGDDQAMVVSKFNADGTPAADFGDGGSTVVNVASGGKAAELARAVAIQADGKIVIAGPVEHDTSATGDLAKDTDVAVLRFNADGTLDPEFGDEGISVIDLGAGSQVNPDQFVGDNSWGVGSLEDGRVVVWGTTLATGEGRTDSDLVMFALGTDGALDTTFGTEGKVFVDIDNVSLNPRHITVQDDGMILATGYGNINDVVQPVLVRVSPTGELDSTFGEGGIATAAPLPGVAESYKIAVQGDQYITAGYGRGADNTEKVDMIISRWDANGALDTTFGTDGVTRIDLAGQDDRGRNVLVLPDNRIVVAGSGKMDADNVDAMVVLLDENGAPVTSFGEDGHLLIDLGGPNDAFYGLGVAEDGSALIVAGYKGVDPEGTENDDAVIGLIPLN